MIEMIKRWLGFSKYVQGSDPVIKQSLEADSQQREELRLLNLQMDVMRGNRQAITGPPAQFRVDGRTSL